MTILKLSIDTGKSYTKFIYEQDGKFIADEIRTNMIHDANETEGDILYYKANRYVVGMEISQITEAQTEMSKISDLHKVVVLTSICRAIESSGQNITEVIATINLPLDEFTRREDKESIQELYDGKYDLVMNDKSYRFTLTIKPYYEGAGIGLAHHNVLKNGYPSIVINFGSLNNSVTSFSTKAKPIIDQSGTFGNGMIELYSSLKAAFRKSELKSDKANSLENIIYGNYRGKDADIVNQIATSTINKHLSKIKAELKTNGIDIDQADVIVGGGGAMMLKPYILDIYGKDVKIDENNMYADCKGALVLLRS